MRRMKGFVNYYINEDEENYRVVRGDKDVYKFKLDKTKVELSDPVAEGLPLGLITHGVMATEHITKVSFGDTLIPEQREQYEAELRQLLADKVGNVAEVVFFDHNLRSEWTLASRNSPAYHVHTDFTYEAAVKRVSALLGEKVAEEWLKDNGHVGIVNVWRPTVRAVEKSPLGFLDVNSVDCKEDIVRVRLEYGARVGIMQGLKKRNSHKWYFINKMRPDQAWIFCQFDSRSRLSVPHSALEIEDTPEDARPRTSIETRCLVRYSD